MLSEQYIFVMTCIISSSLKEIHLIGLPVQQSFVVEHIESRCNNKNNIEDFRLLGYNAV
jgi:hypothetical protein